MQRVWFFNRGLVEMFQLVEVLESITAPVKYIQTWVQWLIVALTSLYPVLAHMNPVPQSSLIYHLKYHLTKLHGQSVEVCSPSAVTAFSLCYRWQVLAQKQSQPVFLPSACFWILPLFIWLHKLALCVTVYRIHI